MSVDWRARVALACCLAGFGASLPAGEAQRPLSELPYTPALDLDALDRRAQPCDDFYQFVCGGWMKNNPVPKDQSRWSVYGKLQHENEQFLWGLMEQAGRTDGPRSPAERLSGDFFAACMDEAAVGRAGADPLTPYLARIDGWRERQALGGLLGELHAFTGGRGALFGFGAEQDLRDSSQVIAWVFAGGLGLPDRDYYLKDDERSRQLREQYRQHVAALLELSGLDAAAARHAAAQTLRLETDLARHSLTRVQRRDPQELDHPLTAAELQALTPGFDWRAYFAALGVPGPARLNATEPEFLKAVARLALEEPLADLRAYLRWHLLRAAARYLGPAWVQRDFEFYGRILHGAEALEPRWKRCVQWTDGFLGEALGQVFVARAFSADTKRRTLDMVEAIERAMQRRLQALTWMGPRTREQALAKLRGMRNKIGYPDQWRDYGGLRIERGDFFGNVARGVSFELRRTLAKIGRPVDRGEWAMTPPTVNAYYDPALNDMNFPAGVLQPPLFDPRLDEAPNYGNTGGTIGHELIHGFDDKGRKFDAQGNLRDWWTAGDASEFEHRAQCIADQYAGYPVVDDIKINSRLTLGEDVADLAGLQLAWDAWREATRGQTLAPRDGFTPEQRFFIGFGQWTCENERPESLRVNALTNPHSPGRWRINGVVVNMPEFAQAFGCRSGQPMARAAESVCRVW